MKRRAIWLAFVISAVSGAKASSLEKPASPVVQILVGPKALPFNKEITLKAGEAFRLLLPNRQEIAVWCRPVSKTGIERLLNSEDLDFDYGEKAFQERPPGRWRQPLGAPDFISTLESDPSIIQEGGVVTWSGGPGHEVILFVDKFRIALREEGVHKGKLPIKVHVRLGTGIELEDLLYGEKAKSYFLPRLRAKEAATRSRAIEKLLEYVTYENLEANFQRPELHPAGRKIREAIGALRGDADPEVRARAERALCVLGDEAAIVRFLGRLPPDNFRSTSGGTEVALWCRNGRGERVAKQILSLLESPDEKLALFALGFFATYEYEPATEKLLKTLSHRSARVRLEALHELKRMERACKMYPAVLSKLVVDADPDIRCKALIWAGNWFPEWADLGETCIACLKDKEAQVRAAAVSGLPYARTPKAIDLLLAATHDSSALVRGAAALALGRSRSEKALDPLVKMLADGDSAVRTQTVYGLRSLNQPRAIPYLRQRLQEEKVEETRRQIKDAIRLIEFNSSQGRLRIILKTP